MDENRIAVIGDYDSIYGFASLGLSTFPVDGERKRNPLPDAHQHVFGRLFEDW